MLRGAPVLSTVGRTLQRRDVGPGEPVAATQRLVAGPPELLQLRHVRRDVASRLLRRSRRRAPHAACVDLHLEKRVRDRRRIGVGVLTVRLVAGPSGDRLPDDAREAVVRETGHRLARVLVELH